MSLNTFLTNIANAIRTKKGTSEPINAQNFASEIINLPSGGNEGVQSYIVEHAVDLPSEASDKSLGLVTEDSFGTWETKTWNGLTNFTVANIWTDGVNTYYSNSNNQYVLNGDTWETKTWNGLTSFVGTGILLYRHRQGRIIYQKCMGLAFRPYP